MNTPLRLNELLPQELAEQLAPEPVSLPEARRLFRAAHAVGGRLDDVPQVRRAVRERAMTLAPGRLTVVDRRQATDGFVKYLFQSPLGGEFEAVRIPIFSTKHVVCVSSQVGCALGCAFCRTASLGFRRNLEAWEIVEQVRVVRDEAALPVKHLVFMGMGEPLLNYDRVLRAARVLCEPGGIEISGRNITLSTAGVVPAIRRYTRERHPFRLIFSITSGDPEKRRALMPIEATHPLESLVQAIGEYAASRRERATLAYVMLAGVNTSLADVEALRKAFAGIPIKLDLIDVADPGGAFRPPDAEELKAFRDALQLLESPIARRYSGGAEIGAACGTLAATRQGGTSLKGPTPPQV